MPPMSDSQTLLIVIFADGSQDRAVALAKVTDGRL